MNVPDRTLTIAWSDPHITAAQAGRMSGLEFLRALIAGEIPPPPVAVTLGFRPVEIESGRAVFTMQPAEHHYNPIGTVHGGVITTLLDSALGCAVHSTLPAGKAYTTLEIKVNFVRAVTVASGMLHCEARVVHAGRQAATAEGRITDAAGKLCAHATTTCLVFDVAGTPGSGETRNP